MAHKFLHSPEEDQAHIKELEKHLADPTVDMVEHERDKIKGAIRTDFILSAEIIVLTLGIVSTNDFKTQVAVLSSIAILMTVGVYGLVAAIVKVDDAGLHLSLKQGEGIFMGFQRWLGGRLLMLAPLLMKNPCSGGYRRDVFGRRRYSCTWTAPGKYRRGACRQLDGDAVDGRPVTTGDYPHRITGLVWYICCVGWR